jgi:hypothetical protein
LETTLTTVRERFKTTWPKIAGVEILLKRIALRRAGAPPPLDGAGLTNDDRAQAAALAVLTRSNFVACARDPSPIALALGPTLREALGKAPRIGPMLQIRMRGVQAIPLLATLVNDAWLLPLRATDLRMGGFNDDIFMDHMSFRGRGFHDFGDALPTPEAIYATLMRPMTRGGREGTGHLRAVMRLRIAMQVWHCAVITVQVGRIGPGPCNWPIGIVPQPQMLPYPCIQRLPVHPLLGRHGRAVVGNHRSSPCGIPAILIMASNSAKDRLKPELQTPKCPINRRSWFSL